MRVVATSGGNHAQTVALAAKNLGIPANIVMPSNSPAIKVRAVEEYGGVVTLCEPSEEVRSLKTVLKPPYFGISLSFSFPS